MILDMRGKACPIPVVETKKAIRSLSEAQIVETWVDNEIAVQNLSKMAGQMGLPVEAVLSEPGCYQVRIHAVPQTSAAQAEPAPAQVEYVPCDCTPKKTVVAIGSAYMGSGSDELGEILMKGFVYALSTQDVLPDTILFFNGGAKLTVEGAATLADLQEMERQGVEIMTCGTCLDYYGLKEKLAVGTVSNMYAIVEKMTQADKVVRI